MLAPGRGIRIVRDIGVHRLSRGTTLTSWLVVMLTSGTLLWMLKAGTWLDQHGGLLSIASWNGHHSGVELVCALIIGILMVLAPVTRGFARATEFQEAVLTGTLCTAFVAIGGVIALALPFLVGALMAIRLAGRR